MSNSVYEPDRWVILKISSIKGVHHRVFATWNSGVFDPNTSWRINSGIEACDIGADEDYPATYYVDGHSGSRYIIKSGEYGICGGWDHILANLVEQGAKTTPQVHVTQLSESEAEKYLDRLAASDVERLNSSHALQEAFVENNF